MFTAFLGLPPILMLAYILLWILSIWFLLVFIRYSYIALFYRNKFYYLGYKSAILWIKNIGKALKEDVFNEDKKLDIKGKIGIIKMRMKELVIKQEMEGIQSIISQLNEVIEKIKDIKKNDLLNLEDQTMSSISDKLKSIIWSNDINEVKSIIENVSWHIDELKNTVSSLDIASIYGDICKELDVHTDEYAIKRDLIMQEIKQLEAKISTCDDNLQSLEESKTEVENNNIKSAMKESKDGDGLVQSIQEDFKNLWHGIGTMVVILCLLSLLVWDILLMYKTVYDLSAEHIRRWEYLMQTGLISVSYETFSIFISLFLPIIILVLIDISIRKAKEWKILGHFFKYGFIFASFVSFGWGFGYFIWTRIFGWDGSTIESIMPFFLLPASLALAYGFEAIANSKKGFSTISAPLVIIPKSIIYFLYTSWKRWQKWIKQSNHRKNLDTQIAVIQVKKDTIVKEITNKESIISSMRDDRDKKILEEVKTHIDIDRSIQNIDKSLIWMAGVNDTVSTALTFADTIDKSLITTFDKIKKARDTDVKKIEKKIEKLKKNISDIEEWFEYAMKKYLVIN